MPACLCGQPLPSCLHWTFLSLAEGKGRRKFSMPLDQDTHTGE